MSKNIKTWFKVSELAKILGLSKVSIYNRLKQINSETLQPLQKVDNGIQYYDIKILNLLQPKEQEQVGHEEPQGDQGKDDQNNYIKDYIKSLQEQIDFLKEQLQTKDRLLENMQVLLKDRPLELEEPKKRGLFNIFKK